MSDADPNLDGPPWDEDAPEAIEEPAEAPVWTMLFSRMVLPPSTRSTAMETTAAGIADAIVMPANRPR